MAKVQVLMKEKELILTPNYLVVLQKLFGKIMHDTNNYVYKRNNSQE
jgi:hypothetical protein